MTNFAPTLLAETLLMTALLIGAVLLLRRPAAKLLGPRFAYALWLVPALRLVLPPLPGGEVVIDAAPPPAALTALDLPAEAMLVDPGLAAAPAPMVSDILWPALLLIWLGGAVLLLGTAVWRHVSWHRALLRHGTALDPVDGIGVVMSEMVDGPVATGLLRRTIAVPADFFARYNRTERELAISHELAHHRAGDLWANAAALVVLAAQWFNPLAWAAHRAFRFDQEAACDARVLADVDADRRARSAHSYACAIAKSVAGPRLLLAAPMTSGTEVKERLTMLTQEPRLGRRPLASRMLIGGCAVAALALTISSLPTRIVYAAEPDAPPPVSAAPKAPGAPEVKEKRVRHVVIVDGDGEIVEKDGEASADGTKKVVRRVIVSDVDGTGSAEAPHVMMFSGDKDGVAAAPHVRLAMPFFGTDKDELRATLKEQGIDDAKADAIIKGIEEKRAKAIRDRFSWSGGGAAHALAVAPVKCKEGQSPNVLIDRSGEAEGAKTKVRMIQCGHAMDRDQHISAMKKARDRLSAQRGETGMSADIRAQVIADMDKAIAELEAKKD